MACNPSCMFYCYLSISFCPAMFVTAAMYLIMILEVSVFPAPDSPEKKNSTDINTWFVLPKQILLIIFMPEFRIFHGRCKNGMTAQNYPRYNRALLCPKIDQFKGFQLKGEINQIIVGLEKPQKSSALMTIHKNNCHVLHLSIDFTFHALLNKHDNGIRFNNQVLRPRQLILVNKYTHV